MAENVFLLYLLFASCINLHLKTFVSKDQSFEFGISKYMKAVNLQVTFLPEISAFTLLQVTPNITVTSVKCLEKCSVPHHPSLHPQFFNTVDLVSLCVELVSQFS